jgi:hypothetical protein
LKLGESAPDELMRWRLAESFGWTLEYIDGLSLKDLNEYISYLDGLAHARKSIL